MSFLTRLGNGHRELLFDRSRCFNFRRTPLKFSRKTGRAERQRSNQKIDGEPVFRLGDKNHPAWTESFCEAACGTSFMRVESSRRCASS
jgi:hypothetical protein